MISPLENRAFQHKARGRLVFALTFAFTFAFGVAMIANSQGAADGTWYWYAVLFRRGERLYSQLQLALQPLFVLESAAFLALLGKSWLATKIPAALHAAALALGLIAIAAYARLPLWQRSLLACSAFLLVVSSVAYRFDDYHVLAELFVVYAIVLLLRMERGVSPRATLALSALLGAFSALSFATRVNNGGALFVGAGIALLCLLPAQRWLALALFAATAGLSLLLVVRLTGDSFHDYWMYTITKAAASKGGSGNVLMNPLLLPWHTLELLLKEVHIGILAGVFLYVCAVWIWLVSPTLPIRSLRGSWRAVLGVVLVTLPILHLRNRGVCDGSFLLSVAAIATFLLNGLGIFAFLRLLAAETLPGRFRQWNRLEILLLIPLGQLGAEALSTGASHGEIYMPMALLFLLLPVVFPLERIGWARSWLLCAATLVAVCGFVYRVGEPYRWWSFRAQPMFVGRQWYRHPIYGPMVIERDMLAFLKPVCRDIDAHGAGRELLSVPYSFGNYFCDIPPWHDYVQTWYDTTEESTIDTLMEQLKTAPPKWILYERQPEVVRFHERLFNGGRPIPQHALDDFIDRKISDGSWKVVYSSRYGSTATIPQDWLLIRTRP